MKGCDPGHTWQVERQSRSYVKYRCADCGSVCVAPKPPPDTEQLVIPRPSPGERAGGGSVASVSGDSGSRRR